MILEGTVNVAAFGAFVEVHQDGLARQSIEQQVHYRCP
jgi:hypothetical protein